MDSIEQAQNRYKNFLETFQSIVLSTATKEGIPNASYAPCVVDENKNIYIFISGLSAHTQNLENNPQVSVMFIEDEEKTQEIFARPRLTYSCVAAVLQRETETWQNIADRFKNKFGQTIDLLCSLPDFRIVKLSPIEGRLVLGFGETYIIKKDNLNQLKPIKPKQ